MLKSELRPERSQSWVRRPENHGEQFWAAVDQIQVWQKLHLPLYVPAEGDARGHGRWVAMSASVIPDRERVATTPGVDQIRLSFEDSESHFSMFASPEQVVAWQERYFVDQVMEIKDRAIAEHSLEFRDEVWKKDQDAMRSDRRSESPSAVPVREKARLVSRIRDQYRDEVILKNRPGVRRQGIFYAGTPMLLRATHQWSDWGIAPPALEEWNLMREEEFVRWRASDFREARDRAAFALEEIPIAVTLQEIMEHGLHGVDLPEAVSFSDYFEALSFLQKQTTERHTTQPLSHDRATRERQRALEERLSIIERWRVCAAPIFIKFSRKPDAPWIQATWEEPLEFSPDRDDFFEKGVRISYEEVDAQSGEPTTITRWIRSTRLIAFQDEYFAECGERIESIERSALLRKIQRFGMESVGLPSAVTVKALKDFFASEISA